MAKDRISDAPHRWSIINDYSKTVITLASGLLAVTVTFSSQLLGAQGSFGLIILLIISWLLLVAAIGFALAAAAYLSVHLGLAGKTVLNEREEKKRDDRAKKCLICSTLSFYSLLSAAAVFVTVGAVQVSSSSKKCSEVEAARKAIETISSIYGPSQQELALESVDLDVSTNTYFIVVSEATAKGKFLVLFDAKGCKVVRSQKHN